MEGVVGDALIMPAKRSVLPNFDHEIQIPTKMASSLIHSPPLPRPSAAVGHQSPASPPPLRRRSLSLLLLSSPAISALPFAPPSSAEDIPLFGLRKKLGKVEEEVEEVVREGEEVVGKEIQAAEQGIQAVEEQIAGGLGLGLGFGDLVQAGAVAGAEAIGVLVGVSVVNGILGPEGKKL